jgi:flagellar biosynthesis anti-sigma factor FlgM
MKIDQNRANLDHLSGLRPEAAKDEKTAAAERATQDGRTDHVQLSSTSQLASTAAAAAADAPAIRPDAVARARARLESGELGNDPVKIAEALIDQLLEKP